MARINYRLIIPWFELEALLKKRLLQLYVKLGRARGEEVYLLQGRVQQLEELINLPDTLAALAGEGKDEQAILVKET